MNEDDWAAFTTRLGYSFQDTNYLHLALTHRSLTNEVGESNLENNERLEFLGDAVIDLSVGCQLMELMPEAREGRLSKIRAMLVSEASLAIIAQEMQLGEFLHLGRGEEQTGGRKKASILADAFEALIGAIFLDGGFAAAHLTVGRLLGPMMNTIVEGDLDLDHKTRLQELAQGQLHVIPRYEVIGERGPDHAKTFTVAVYLAEEEIARAEGRSKKAAEQRAARLAVAVLDRQYLDGQ